MYIVRDIETTTNGDIVIAPGGDVSLANSFETVKATVNFIARTDKGGYQPDRRIGGDLGVNIGSSMSKESTSSMENGLRANLSKFILNPSDFQVHAIPIEINTVGVFVAIGGQYLDEDGNILNVESTVLSYTFPYFDGDPSPLAE